MPYIIETTTDRAKMIERPPSGPGFSEADVELAAKMEVWGSSFLDPDVLVENGPRPVKFTELLRPRLQN